MHSSQSSFPCGAGSIVCRPNTATTSAAAATVTRTASLLFLPVLSVSSNHLRHAHHNSHMTFDLEPPEEGDDGGGNPLLELTKRTSSSAFPTFSHNLSSTSSSFDLEDNENISFFVNSSISSSVPTPTGNVGSSGVGTLYGIIVPLMISCCIVTCLVNLVIVTSSRWCRKPMSPTLYFSISLALADAYASFFLGLGLVINSLLPFVYGVDIPNKCFALTVEAFRVGGILVLVCHLLALGINHWIGIVRPLHYAATMTRRTAWGVIIASWISPITMIFVYYASVPGEGFLSSKCLATAFLKGRTYRTFFAACFFAPLALMSLIYLHIFLIVRNHSSHRLRYQVKTSQSITSSSPTTQSSTQLRRNVKAVLTTVLILGTYVIGWLPATLFSIIACDDCFITLEEVPMELRLAIGITVNFLVIFKTLVDPIIYAARMSDIKLSLRKMRYAFLDVLVGRCMDIGPPPEPDTHRGGLSYCHNRSLYESKSVRMASVGSTASARRAAAANGVLHRSGSSAVPNGRSFNKRASSSHSVNASNNTTTSMTPTNGNHQTNLELLSSPHHHHHHHHCTDCDNHHVSHSPKAHLLNSNNKLNKAAFEMTELR